MVEFVDDLFDPRFIYGCFIRECEGFDDQVFEFVQLLLEYYKVFSFWCVQSWDDGLFLCGIPAVRGDV